MYGAAQPTFKDKFLTQLVETFSKENLPILFGGDFNIIRNPKEKNNDKYDDRWPFLFNAIIDSLNLRELKIFGRKFTWANSLPIPTYERLERVLVNPKWEQQSPLGTVAALTREISYHTPAVKHREEGNPPSKQLLFKFELSFFFWFWWLKCGGRKQKEIHLCKDGKIR